MCDHVKTKVVDTRIRNGFLCRRRVCLDCSDRFSTVEVPFDSAQGKPFLLSLRKVLAQIYKAQWMPEQMPVERFEREQQ